MRLSCFTLKGKTLRKRNRFDEPITFDNISLEPESTILGIVCEPDIADCSDQVLSREVINEAMTLYNDHFNNILLQHKDSRGREPDFTQVANIQTLDNWQHTFNDKVKIINSFVTSEDTLIESQPVRSGTWLMELEIKDEAIQEKISKGKLTGLSYGGAGCLFPVNSHKQILSLMPGEVSLVNKACNRRSWLRKAEQLQKKYPNEMSCRLKPPTYSEYTRGTRTSQGREYSIIFGRNEEGSLEQQAFRYNKKIWARTSAEAHCKRHKGQFHDIERKEE